jgi:hypothetical protein
MPADPSKPEDEPAGGRFATMPDGDTNRSSREALHDALKQLAETVTFAQYYVAAIIDGYKSAAKRAGLYAIVGIFTLIFAVAVLVTATVMALYGAAHGLGALFGGRVWLGELIVGVGALAWIVLAVWLLFRKMRRTWHEQTVAKYESLKRRQRTGFGRDVDDAAAEHTANE